MKFEYQEEFGNICLHHFFNPGRNCDDDTLVDMYDRLLSVNKESDANIIHPMLKQGMTTSELRKTYGSCIVGLIQENNNPVGFLITPYLEKDGFKIHHAGLVVISKNNGTNLIALCAAKTACIAYQKSGKYYATNITSTPSIVEAFDFLVTKVWPSPDVKLVKPPREYRKVFEILYDDYIKVNFLNGNEVRADRKRFVIRSSSNDMGFNTNMRQLSRASDFRYMNFCFVWLDYSQEEDLIQVGEFGLKDYLKIMGVLKLWKIKSNNKSKTRVTEKIEPINSPNNIELATHK